MINAAAATEYQYSQSLLINSISALLCSLPYVVVQSDGMLLTAALWYQCKEAVALHFSAFHVSDDVIILQKMAEFESAVWGAFLNSQRRGGGKTRSVR